MEILKNFPVHSFNALIIPILRDCLPNYFSSRPTALAVGAGAGCLDIFALLCSFSLLSPPLWETARCGLGCCLGEPLVPGQPASQPIKPPSNFIAGRPKAALLFWFFGGFRCGVLLFINMLVVY